MIHANHRREVSDLLARSADAQQEAEALIARTRALTPTGSGVRSGRLLRRCYLATPLAVRWAAQAITRVAGALPATRAQSVQLAVSEAMTNAVIHAYRGAPGPVHLTAGLAGDELIVIVADDGAGPPSAPDQPNGGAGWPLIAAATDHLSISQRPNGGTLVMMRWSLTTRAARETTRTPLPPSDTLSPPTFDTTPQIDGGSERPAPKMSERA